MSDMQRELISSAPQMMEAIQQLGFVPLLWSGIRGFSAEEMVDQDCRYVVYDDGWDWPMWKWKGPIINEGNCVYGKFFDKKAGYISLEWWPDFCNWRLLLTLQEHGSLITRELRSACGFTGPKMRSRFDAYVTRLQMACRIVTEDFVYPRDRHGHEYGWGWSLLTTPERLYGREACQCGRSPQESHDRIFAHLRQVVPQATDRQLLKLI